LALRVSVEIIFFEFPGLWSDAVPPLPIPNREVKRTSGDDTALATVWDNTSRPGFLVLNLGKKFFLSYNEHRLSKKVR